jgi:hypothetical protein
LGTACLYSFIEAATTIYQALIEAELTAVIGADPAAPHRKSVRHA